MRLLQVVHGWFPRHAGGTERYVAALCRELVERGHEVALLAGSDRAADHPRIEREEWCGLPLFRIRRAGLFLESWYHSHSPEVESLVREVVEEWSPDVVHVHHWQRLTRNLVETLTEAGLPTVATLHDVHSTCPRLHRVVRGRFDDSYFSAENWSGEVERLWFQDDEEIHEAIDLFRLDFAQELAAATALIAPSRTLAGIVGAQHPDVAEAIRVLPHGALFRRAGRWRRPRPRPREDGEPLRLVYWGELSPVKGVHLLAEALGRSRRRESFELDLWGRFAGNARAFEKAFRERARSLPIRFRGDYEPADLPAGRYDLAVFPSVARESHGFTVDEAFELGLPVVVPDRGGPADRLGGAGRTFESESAAALAAALEGILDDSEALGEMVAAIRRPTSMRRHVEELAEVYAAARDAGPHPERLDPERRRARRDELSRRLRRRERLLDEQRARLGDADARIAAREDESRRKEAVLSGFNEQLERLASALAEKDRALADASLEAQRTVRSLEERGRDVARQARELDEMAASAEELRLALTAAEQGRRAAEDESVGLREELDGRAEEVERLRADLETRDAVVAARDRDIEDFARSAEELREELARVLRDATGARAALEERERRIAELSAEREAALEAREGARAEAERARGEQERLERELRRASSEAEGLAETLEEERRRRARLEQLRENLVRQRERESSSLSLHEEALERTVGELEAERERLRGAAEAAAARLGAVADELGRPRPEAEDLLSWLDVAESSHHRLHGLLGERDALLEALSGELAALADARRQEAVRRAPSRTSARLRSGLARLGRRISPRAKGERMRILTVVHDFLPKHAAGTEIYTYKLDKELSQRHDLHLLFCEARHERERYTVSKGEYDGLPYTEVVHNYRWRGFEETYKDPRMEAIFESVLDEFEPDIVHIQHLHYFSFDFITLAKNRGLPVVYTLHEFMLLCARGGQLLREDMEICRGPVPEKCADCIRHWPLLEDYGQDPRRRRLDAARGVLPPHLVEAFDRFTGPIWDAPLSGDERRVYAAAAERRLDHIRERVRQVDLFISPSAFLRERMIANGMVPEDRIIHSDNGFDTSPFEGVARVPSERIRFGFVGTIAPYKGVHLLIEAFEGLEDPRAELQIWGDLETFAEYKEELLALPRSEAVRLMGRFDNGRIAEVLAGIDVLIVPSLWYENSPLTIHEAWMAGIPVIASDQGGMAELVEDGVNGLHFRLGDAEDLRAKIEKVLAEPELLERWSRSLGRVKTIADNAREIEGYYRELLAGRSVNGERSGE